MCWTTSPNTTSTSLENLLNSTLSNLQHCDCEKETEFGFCSVKRNTVEESECECSRRGKKVNLKSSIPVVKATTCPRSAGRDFVAPSFLVNKQYLKDYNKILGTLGLDHVHFTQWINIIEWISPFVKGSPTGACKKQELKQFNVMKKSSSTAFI